MTENRLPVDRSGRSPDNINRGTVLLEWGINRWTVFERINSRTELQLEKTFRNSLAGSVTDSNNLLFVNQCVISVA